MPRRIHLYLFIATCLLFSALSMVLPTAALDRSIQTQEDDGEERQEGDGVEVTYIQYGLIDYQRWLRLEGMAAGSPELIVLYYNKNQELREIPVNFVECTGAQSGELCWETEQFIEEHPPQTFFFDVFDLETDTVVAEAWILFGRPIQCSTVCGKVGD